MSCSYTLLRTDPWEWVHYSCKENQFLTKRRVWLPKSNSIYLFSSSFIPYSLTFLVSLLFWKFTQNCWKSKKLFSKWQKHAFFYYYKKHNGECMRLWDEDKYSGTLMQQLLWYSKWVLGYFKKKKKNRKQSINGLEFLHPSNQQRIGANESSAFYTRA